MTTDLLTPGVPLPAVYERARQALETCETIDECKDWSDKAAALASYARQADDETLLLTAMRIRARAIRRMGEVLEEIEPASGGDRKSEEYQAGSASPLISRKDAAEAAGISPDQAKDAVRVARIPAEDFEREVEADRPATITKLAAMGTRPTRPLVDLKGRDPNQFNRAMHFVAHVRDYERSLAAMNLPAAVADLNDDERATMLKALDGIDVAHHHLRGDLNGPQA